MRRLDLGVASFGNPEKLRATLTSVLAHSTTDLRVFVIHNPGAADDEAARAVVDEFAGRDSRIVPHWMPENAGYAGAVNKLFELAETEYVAYCDNDIWICTQGWDEKLIAVMDANPEVGWMFPGRGHYGFHNGSYNECLWSAGYCWIMRANTWAAVANHPSSCGIGCKFDTRLGHHEEVDFMIRLRLAGFRTGCCPDVDVAHHESATRRSAEDHKPGGRIHDGVVRWMNKWNRYFCGDGLKYSMTAYDAAALRYTDWNVDALYLERMTLHHFPDWNATPEVVHVPGVGEMEAVKVLKPKGCYVRRAI